VLRKELSPEQRALFSDYYLTQRLPTFPQWAEDPKPAYLQLRQLYQGAGANLVGKEERILRENLLEPALRQLPAVTAEVLFGAAREAVRNAVKHGGKGLTISVSGTRGIELTVADDGPGFGAEAGTDGSGQGLALYDTLMAVVGGSMRLENAPTRVLLSLPEGTSPLSPSL